MGKMKWKKLNWNWKNENTNKPTLGRLRTAPCTRCHNSSLVQLKLTHTMFGESLQVKKQLDMQNQGSWSDEQSFLYLDGAMSTRRWPTESCPELHPQWWLSSCHHSGLHWLQRGCYERTMIWWQVTGNLVLEWRHACWLSGYMANLEQSDNNIESTLKIWPFSQSGFKKVPQKSKPTLYSLRQFGLLVQCFVCSFASIIIVLADFIPV